MASLSQLQCFLYQKLIILLLLTPLVVSSALNMSLLTGCPDKCGDISIPYPFGTRTGCYRPGLYITCDESTTPPKARAGNIELIDINITSGEARFYSNIAYACYNETAQVSQFRPEFNTSNTTYLISSRSNKFTAIGCCTAPLFFGRGNATKNYEAITSCVSNCESINSTSGDGDSCNGRGCCEAVVPAGLSYYWFNWVTTGTCAASFNPCTYSMVVEEDWYIFQVRDLYRQDFLGRNPKGVPTVLDWAIRENGTCLESHVESNINPACQSKKSRCDNATSGDGYLCKCLRGYEGNPYIPDGCIDIDECKFPDIYSCSEICTNTEGDYQCPCPKGTSGDAKAGNCIKDPHVFPISLIVTVITCTGFGFLALLLGAFKLVRLLKKIRSDKMKKKFFEKNNGLLLQQHISSNQSIAERMRIFSLEDLEKATNKFEQNRIVGRGGHGIVYKGILSDQRVVAVKRSFVVIQREIDQFINEVVILSQIDHRNVVKLYGCCLESEVPLLVYEFISNGTLFHHLHVDGSLSWKNRFRIALETARALAHLHSAASISVFHRDIKSTNILLDDYLTTKVSDFGASRTIRMDQSRVTTAIQGTYGYLDPEYYYTGKLTDKSDVYSFGVILAELLTRKKPTSFSKFEEGENLASFFCLAVRENRLNDILDPLIIEEVHRSQIDAVAALAEMSLRLKGDERPTMKEVEMRLEVLHGSKKGQYQSVTTDEAQNLLNNQLVGGEATRQYSIESELIWSSQFGR